MNDSSQPEKGRRKKNSLLLPFLLAAIICLGLAFIYYQQKQKAPHAELSPAGTDQTSSLPPNTDSGGTFSAAPSVPSVSGQGETTLPVTSTPGPPEGPSPVSATGTSPEQPPAAQSVSGLTALDSTTDWPSDLSLFVPVTRADCDTLSSKLDSFYQHLDHQEYMRAFALEGSSRQHFSQLMQKLLDNPPVVSRETDDLFTLLQNTAHFFRVLGKDNIVMLKGILDRERNSLEAMLKTLDQLRDYPECLEERYQLHLNEEAVLDYAAFLLNTMGGRLYLFRRDSTSRMAVTFYAIKVIRDAQMRGNDRLGIDLRPAIEQLIDEMENGGKRLKYKELYLDSLYDMLAEHFQ